MKYSDAPKRLTSFTAKEDGLYTIVLLCPTDPVPDGWSKRKWNEGRCQGFKGPSIDKLLSQARNWLYSVYKIDDLNDGERVVWRMPRNPKYYDPPDPPWARRPGRPRKVSA